MRKGRKGWGLGKGYWRGTSNIGEGKRGKEGSWKKNRGANMRENGNRQVGEGILRTKKCWGEKKQREVLGN